MAVLVKVDGKESPVLPDFGRPDFTIQQLQDMVDSPFITVIPLKRLGNGRTIFMVADEEGFERDRPFHPTASREASRAIYGDVVIAKYEELGGAKEL